MLILGIVFIVLSFSMLLPIPLFDFEIEEEAEKFWRKLFFLIFLIIGCVLLGILIIDLLKK